MARIRVNLDEIPDFVSMSPGKTRSKLIEVENDVSQKGNDMLVWKWEGIEGENEGRTINSYTSLLDDALGGLKTHLKAFGYNEGEVDVDTRKLHGKTALLIIAMRKYRDRDTGEEREGASVSNVLPDSKKASAGEASTKSKARISKGSDDVPF